MLSLNGKWKVTHVPYCSPIDFILSPSFVPEGWLDAAVPEEIHRTLRNAGIIRGNVYGKTEEEELWIEQADWVYHKEFFVLQQIADFCNTCRIQPVNGFVQN